MAKKNTGKRKQYRRKKSVTQILKKVLFFVLFIGFLIGAIVVYAIDSNPAEESGSTQPTSNERKDNRAWEDLSFQEKILFLYNQFQIISTEEEFERLIYNFGALTQEVKTMDDMKIMEQLLIYGYETGNGLVDEIMNVLHGQASPKGNVVLHSLGMITSVLLSSQKVEEFVTQTKLIDLYFSFLKNEEYSKPGSDFDSLYPITKGLIRICTFGELKFKPLVTGKDSDILSFYFNILEEELKKEQEVGEEESEGKGEEERRKRGLLVYKQDIFSMIRILTYHEMGLRGLMKDQSKRMIEYFMNELKKSNQQILEFSEQEIADKHLKELRIHAINVLVNFIGTSSRDFIFYNEIKDLLIQQQQEEEEKEPKETIFDIFFSEEILDLILKEQEEGEEEMEEMKRREMEEVSFSVLLGLFYLCETTFLPDEVFETLITMKNEVVVELLLKNLKESEVTKSIYFFDLSLNALFRLSERKQLIFTKEQEILNVLFEILKQQQQQQLSYNSEEKLIMVSTVLSNFLKEDNLDLYSSHNFEDLMCQMLEKEEIEGEIEGGEKKNVSIFLKNPLKVLKIFGEISRVNENVKCKEQLLEEIENIEDEELKTSALQMSSEFEKNEEEEEEEEGTEEL